MGNHERRRSSEEFLASMDEVLLLNTVHKNKSAEVVIPQKSREVFKPVIVDKIERLTHLIYGEVQLHNGKKTDEETESQKELTALKDISVDLVRKAIKKDEYFPGTKELRTTFASMVTEKRDAKLREKYRAFRNEALSHVLSTNPNSLTPELEEKVWEIREKYNALYKQYAPRLHMY